MAIPTIRNLDEAVETRLRMQAAAHGQSIESEARDILRVVLHEMPPNRKGLGIEINALFKPLGGIELDFPAREPMRDPPEFGE